MTVKDDALKDAIKLLDRNSELISRVAADEQFRPDITDCSHILQENKEMIRQLEFASWQEEIPL